eukprot:TRINITY_DN263_c5_g2_i1.p1 TRINITY_DN263_c5_g2~~TRINITY_DN263_c5_g2_i1.p1  ORF type:complete len:261 (+),score=49.16 TRINITY_DN263_c5_g2_i1:174-956(+)
MRSTTLSLMALACALASLMASVSVVHAGSACSSDGYDLSPLTVSDTEPYSYTQQSAGQKTLWYFNFCAPASQPKVCPPANNSGVCQIASNGLFKNAGSYTDISWVALPKEIGSEGIGLAYGDGTLCGVTPRNTTLFVYCSESDEMTVDQVVSPTGSCSYQIWIKSKYVCGGGSSGAGFMNLVSWIFLICFVVGVVVYLVCGSVYKFKVRDERGMEMIPNIDFWREFPSLLWDGTKQAGRVTMWTVNKVSCKKIAQDYETL